MNVWWFEASTMARLYGHARAAMALGVFPLSCGISRLQNATTARGVIELCRQIKFSPATLIDVGARESEFAWWMQREWPTMNLLSVEPNPACHPRGHVLRCALSDRAGRFKFDSRQGGGSRIMESGDIEVEVRLGEEVWPALGPDTVIKFDCENHTLRAMRGMGMRLAEARMLIVEVANNDTVLGFEEPQHLGIYRAALEAGFTMARTVYDGFHAGTGPVFCDVVFWKPAPISG